MKLIWQLGENIGGFCGAGYMVQGSGITHDRGGGGWRENTGYNKATVANRQRTQAITGQLLPTDRELRL
jgi:hypothetical protein